MTDPTLISHAAPPPLPVLVGDPGRAVTSERLRLLSIACRISGILGVVFVPFLLIHLCLFTVISFVPESAFQSKGNQHSTTLTNSQQNIQTTANPSPPAIIFRIVAGIIAVVILCGWILGGLTYYAGHCIAKRQKRTFVLVMAGINCIWIPYGLLLGISAFLALGSEDAKLEYGG